jgi:hypothetical protein
MLPSLLELRLRRPVEGRWRRRRRQERHAESRGRRLLQRQLIGQARVQRLGGVRKEADALPCPNLA